MAVNPSSQRAQGARRFTHNLLERRLVHFLLITSLMTVLALLVHAPRWGATEYLDHLALDQYFVLRGQPPVEAIAEEIPHTRDIILIETTHQIPRPILAKLLEKIRMARVIAIDMMFVDSEAELEVDEKELYQQDIQAWRKDTDVLARKIKELGNVVIGSWPEQVRDPEPKIIWQRPAQPIWNSAYQRAHFVVEPDRWDLKVRTVPLFKTIEFVTRRNGQWQKSAPQRVPSLGLATAATAMGISTERLQQAQVQAGVLRAGKLALPVDPEGVMLIDYVGGRQSFESDANHRNYMQVLKSEFEEPEHYKNKIVIIGESSFKSKEIMDTPFGDMPGMQIHANVIATILSRTGPPRPLPLWQTACIALVCSLWLVAPLVRLPLWGSFIFAGLQIALLIYAGAWIFAAFHYVLPVSVPAIAIVLTYNAIALYEYRRARHTLGRFIGQEMVSRTMDLFSPPKLGGELGKASAFFCDLRGFTGFASSMPPEDVTRLINSYTDTLVKVVKKYGGRPIDYQGDGVFVLFEPSLAGPEYSVSAVRAAMEMQQVFLELRQQWAEEGAPLMEMGIGIDTGTLMIGAVGSEQHLKMGAVGDAVNTAARVQRLNVECGYTVLITRNTYDLVRHVLPARYCGDFKINGREQPIEIYGVETLLAATDEMVSEETMSEETMSGDTMVSDNHRLVHPEPVDAPNVGVPNVESESDAAIKSNTESESRVVSV